MGKYLPKPDICLMFGGGRRLIYLERETGIEPATFSLGS